MYNFSLEKVALPRLKPFLGESFISHLKEPKDQVELTGEELKINQSKKLKLLLDHPGKNSPYYAQFKKEVLPENPYGAPKLFPIFEKTDIRINTDSLVTQLTAELVKHSSSGSKGFQTTVYWSKREQALNRVGQRL